MRRSPPTPDQLTDSPELSVLEIVESTALITRGTLIAAHPELAWGPLLVEQPDVTPRLCLAASVIAALDALRDSVEQYLAHVDALALQGPPCGDPDPDDDIPF